MSGEVNGWRDKAKRKKDSWTWTAVYQLPGGGGWVEVEEGIWGMNGNRKNRIKVNIYIELTQVYSRKTNNTMKKWAKDLNSHFSSENMQRSQRHMKRCSASLAIREMRIKTTMRHHFTPIRMVIINKQ